MQIHHHEVLERKILIVDDDHDFQMLLQNCLKKEGYACVGAVSAEEALERFRESPPDLVILDLGLSKASGIAFLQNFTKTISDSKKIPPVLVVSGYSDPEIVELVASLGAARFISKPVGCLELVLAIRSFFGNISHEIWTPISILKMGIDNLEVSCKGRLEKDEIEIIEVLKRNTEHLEKLITDLLGMVPK